MRVPHVAVAMNAGMHFALGIGRQHLVNDVLVAVQARVLRHAPIPRLDLNRLVKVLKRKCQRMKESVVSLRDPFADRVMRQVAIVADRDVAVRGILPRVVVPLHDMAIRAAPWVIAQVARAFAIAKREHADSDENPKHHGQDNRKERQHSPPRTALHHRPDVSFVHVVLVLGEIIA